MPYSLTYTSLVDSLKVYAERTGDTTMNAILLVRSLIGVIS